MYAPRETKTVEPVKKNMSAVGVYLSRVVGVRFEERERGAEMGWCWTLHTHYATGGAVEILTLVFEGFGERGFGGEGEVSGGGRHGAGGGQMDQLREWWLLLLQAMVGGLMFVVGVEVESGSIPKLQMKFGAEKSAMFGCFETFF